MKLRNKFIQTDGNGGSVVSLPPSMLRIITILIPLLIAFATFSFGYGVTTRQIEVNSKRLDTIENLLPVMQNSINSNDVKLEKISSDLVWVKEYLQNKSK